MLSFECDYAEGAHEKIMQRLIETNREQKPGYGVDGCCDRAKDKIRAACGCPEAEVYFLVGGTQTNQIVIDSMLQSYEGVVAVRTGHVNGHEAGAIEYTGHKVLALPHKEGKLEAALLRTYLKGFYEDSSYDHMVFPGMVYITHPTEYGTLYTKRELLEIKAVCTEYQIPLYLDGARLGYGLGTDGTDVTLKDIADICDAFYIGGTKLGALFGEAVVFPKGNAPKHFFTRIKQHGGLLAKGWLLGLQFDTLFTDDLYVEIGRHAVRMADRIRAALRGKGYTFYMDSPTNQIFIVLPNDGLEQLQHKVVLSVWEKPDEDHTVVRITTSWATTEEMVRELTDIL